MMESLRSYILSVICAALTCGILLGFLQNGSAKEVVKLLCGVFLTLTVIRPISSLDLDSLPDISMPYTAAAAEAASSGESMAAKAMAESIKQECETYILDKAAELNAQIRVDVTVNSDCIPVCAEFRGEISPYNQQKLQNILEADLGITKEQQLWTG